MGDSNHFEFDGVMVGEYEDHVRDSVPCYDEIHKLVIRLLNYYIPKKCSWLDIGSGTGTLQKKFSDYVGDHDYTAFGIDNSPDMIAKANLISNTKTQFEHIDITEDFRKLDHIGGGLEDAGYQLTAVTSILSSQFMLRSHRDKMTEIISEMLPQGGVYILVEKVLPDDSLVNQIFTDLYYEFKSDNGICDDAIIGKMRSLRSVMKPYVMDEIRYYSQLFTSTECFFTYLNFKGYIFQK